ncbi:MAG: hypothetical protein IPP48_08470 [Chitinophagaceae bacterium]|nr:hypothetical protein [Chitinophagaceae bacterium]
MKSKQQNQKLILFSILLLITLSYPLLSIGNKLQLIFGLPLLYFYIFFVWVFSVVTIGLIVKEKHHKTDE